MSDPISVTMLRTRFEATGVSDEEADRILVSLPNSPWRAVVEYEIAKRAFQETINLKTVPVDKIVEQRGVVQGLDIAIGILKRK